MAILTFELPADLSPDSAGALGRACMTGGQDDMPAATQAARNGHLLSIERAGDESGCVLVPWTVEKAGQLMVGSATLLERPAPFQLAVELARGKINQLRNQASDWQMGGLQMPSEVASIIRQATLSFGKGASRQPTPEANQLASAALVTGLQAAEQLVETYTGQVFQVRHQRQPQLDTLLTCRLGASAPADELIPSLREAFHAVRVPFSWNQVEPAEADFRWEPFDAVVHWAESQGLPVQGGPLIDFSAGRLPDWLWLWEGDLASLAGFMGTFVEAAIKRYKGRIRNWQLTAASNCASVLGLSEEELLWLTIRLAETARSLEPDLELVAGIAQPWGDYLATQERMHSPFIFADNLIRSNLHLAALDLEIIMGVSPRGSYCRDLLEVSRLLDLFALLGMPVQVTLGYPSATAGDSMADSSFSTGAGRWHAGMDLATQADWATAFAGLTLCKPYVRNVQWAHFLDGERHQFPHCGLVDRQGNVKPALARLSNLRREHLR